MGINDTVIAMYMASFPEPDPRPTPAGVTWPYIPEDPKDKTMREILDELRLIREILEHPPKSLTEKRMRQMVRVALGKGKKK